MENLNDLKLDNKAIYFIDIDGVMCRSYHYDVDRKISQESWVKCKKETLLEKDSISFIENLLKNNIEFYFLTGRSINSKELTESMFKNSNFELYVDKIIYNNTNNYDLQIFLENKITVINAFRIKYNKKIVIIDDHEYLIDIINFMNFQQIEAIYFALPYLSYSA